MEHQDWTEIVFRKKVTYKKPLLSDENIVPKYDTSRNRQNKNVTPAKKIEEKIENEEYIVPKISHSMQIQIQQARHAKNWTQKQLAQACNIQMSIVRDYENGTVKPNRQDILKMNKALGVVLKK
jgi:ribosome-binding protein aMBF1 (putative translation factor)